MTSAYLVTGVRTPFGRYAGGLAALELAGRQARRALATLCVGVVQGIPLLLEQS